MNKYIEICRKQVQRILWPEELAFNQTHKVQASERSKPSKITLDVASLWQGPHEQQVCVGVVPNSLQDIGQASDGAKRRPVAGGLGRSVAVYTPLLGFRGDLILL